MITLNVTEDCKKGKQKAHKKLFETFTNVMFSVCVRYMKNTEEAEDPEPEKCKKDGKYTYVGVAFNTFHCLEKTIPEICGHGEIPF